jgi:hypothetical protein
MIQEHEILNEIQDIRKKTELLANPLYSDFVGSHFWGDIDKQLQDIENKLLKDKEIYKWQ